MGSFGCRTPSFLRVRVLLLPSLPRPTCKLDRFTFEESRRSLGGGELEPDRATQSSPVRNRGPQHAPSFRTLGWWNRGPQHAPCLRVLGWWKRLVTSHPRIKPRQGRLTQEGSRLLQPACHEPRRTFLRCGFWSLFPFRWAESMAGAAAGCSSQTAPGSAANYYTNLKRESPPFIDIFILKT